MATQDERKAETRDRLLRAAASQFASRGYHAVSVEALAEAAGRTTGALYAHFGSKDGLLLALLDAWADQTVDEITDEFASAGATDDQLLALWRRFSDAGPADWQLLEHELWLQAARNHELGERLAQRFGGERVRIADGVRAWQAAAGTDAPAGPDGTATLLLAMLVGLAMQRRVDPDAVPDDLVLDGLRRLVGTEPSTPPARVRHRADTAWT